MDGSVGVWGLFASAFVSATIAPGGSEAVLAWLVAQGDFRPVSLLVVATVGNSLGALTTWLLGSLTAAGYPLCNVGGERSQKAIAGLRRWGVPALLFSWLPVVGDALCFAGGWLRLPLVRSMFVVTAGKALRYAVVVFAFM